MAIYMCIAVVGLVFLVFSALAGGHDADGDAGGHDVGGHDVGGHDVGAGTPSPLSTRVMMAFLTMFGVVGAAAKGQGASHLRATIYGLIGGLIVGLITWLMFLVFWKAQANSIVRPDDMVGATGEVKTGIPEGGVGQVCVMARGQRSYCTARAHDGHAIPEGAIVKVVACAGNDVTVERTSNH